MRGVAAAPLTAPQRLTIAHDLTSFSSKEQALDRWLKAKALKSEGTARTFVVCAGDRVAAYYCLSSGSFIRKDLPKKVQRNTPDWVPVVLLGRLAVDREYEGRGIGSALLKDVFFRSLRIYEEVGFRAILVHALDDKAVGFYRRFDFLPSPIDPRTLALPVELVRSATGTVSAG